MSETILSVKNLCTSFTTEKGEVMAVNGVPFIQIKGNAVYGQYFLYNRKR